jgi:RimJ/RimL family protein N-acetyltransferase
MKNSEIKDISLEDIELKPGSGQNLLDKINGKYWHIYISNDRVGKVYIDYIDNKILGIHPSVDIFINKQFQGRHIGRYAYLLACQKSGLERVFMHTRKSNHASIKAAEEAGFIELQNPNFRQMVMVWEKSNQSNL